MLITGSRVPMFKLQPYRGLLVLAVLVLAVGGLFSAYLFREDAYLENGGRGWLALAVTVILTLLLVVCAYSRYGFRHLWHHRPGYKRG